MWVKTNSLSVFLLILSLFQKRKLIYLVSYSPSKYATAIEFYVSFFLNIPFLHNLAYMTSIHSLHHDHSYIFLSRFQHRIRTVAPLQILFSWPANELVKGNVNIHSSSLKYYYNFPVISRINFKYLDLIFKSPSFLGMHLLHKYHTTTVASRHVASHGNITFSYIERPSQSPFFQNCCPLPSLEIPSSWPSSTLLSVPNSNVPSSGNAP